MQVWTIKDWNERWEDAASRKLQRPTYIPMRIEQGSLRFRELMQTKDGAAAFGHFVALVQLAATMPNRGVLMRSGTPLTPELCAAIIGVPVKVMQASWKVLAGVGWLVQISQSDPDDPPLGPQQSPSRTPVIRQLTPDKKNRTEQKELTPALLRNAAPAGGRRGIAWSVDDGWSGDDDAEVGRLSSGFPGLDVRSELAAMDAWLRANPAKAHKKNWAKFVTNWMLRTRSNGNGHSRNGGGITAQQQRRARQNEDEFTNVGALDITYARAEPGAGVLAASARDGHQRLVESVKGTPASPEIPW
jgi:hypothetical protein